MTPSERVVRRACALIGMLAMTASGAPAQQQTPARPEVAATEIREALRAFYFNLAHHDWEAVAAGILPAKVVAHHQAPPSVVAASQPHARPGACGPTIEERVRGAELTIAGDWAAASVTRCGAGEVAAGESGADGFRFIRFDGHWWIVYIELFDEPLALQLAR